MRHRVFVLLVTALTVGTATTVTGQTTSELSGRVIYEDHGLAGVTVTVQSPSLQGLRTTTTNADGDYILKFLPAGDYTVRFELDTFAGLEYQLKITTSQPKFLDAVMYPEAMQGEIVVAGQYEAVSTGSQGSQTIEQSMLEQLPVPRDLRSAVLLSAGTATYGGLDRISISGAQTGRNLYTTNGVVLNENMFGYPYDMFIEDAILETTTMTSSISAEYGRFSGGVVNMVTKSGGNEFSGSARANFSNDSWNGRTPLTVAQIDTTNEIYEATVGGRILSDKLWFFLAGRSQSLGESRQLVTPGQPDAAIPYSFGDDETRFEGKLTWAVTPSHRLMGNYIKIDRTLTNFSELTPADTLHIAPLFDLPLEGYSFSYNGVFSDHFFAEALYSKRDFTFVGGAGNDPRLGATPVWDLGTGVAFNAPLFCNASARPECTDEQRNNENIYAKASYFFNASGTHDLVFGLDTFDDMRIADNWQSATGYIWAPFVPQDYSEPGNPYTVIEYYGGYIIWGAVLQASKGSHFKTNSAFINDTWRVSDRWTANLGLRYDANRGTDQGGAKAVDDALFGPRLSATWDIGGDGKVILTGGASRYVKEIGQFGDRGAGAGNQTFAGYLYLGPTIVAGTEEYPTNFDAISAMFDWFFNVYGGPTNTFAAGWVEIPGLTPKIAESLSSPYADELTVGASFRLGTHGVLRVDALHRAFRNNYAGEIVPNRWAESEEYGVVVDQEIYINDNDLLNRTYDAILARFDYRVGSRWSIGANATVSELRGNTGGAGLPVSGEQGYEYQEYKDPSWNSPETTSRLSSLRAWAIWNAISTNRHNLSLSLLQSFRSGNPYSAAGQINTIPYVGSPADLGYAGSPGVVDYVFEPGAYRTDDITSTDLALNYSFFITVGGGQLELFVQPEVTNVFNETGVVSVNTIVYTSADRGSGLQPFNPWTTAPVEGVHWAKGPNFGQPMVEGDYQQPRTFRISVGLRF